MKIILFYSVFFVFGLNGRFTSTEIAGGFEKSVSERDQIESLEQVNRNAQNPELKLANIEKSVNFFEPTEKQELLLPTSSIAGDPPLLDNIQVSSELSSTSETVVFPSADSVVELQNRGKNQYRNEKGNGSSQFYTSLEKEEYVVHAEPKVQVRAITEETVKATVNESESVPKSSQEEAKKTAPQHEDIPSFSEWTQKQLAEAEKKKTDQNETSERFTKTRGKFRNKNYASPDCGAKIVASNPESLSSSAVLSSLKDEYMLNYCTNRIWFVVELCEAIQAKQLDLANFELFSSSPKHFSVSISHRFPTREWSNVGKFTAQDSRDVQTFNLHPHLFGKFVKVELHSHYGREQFCPISYVAVYGTSEYEVLAKEDERHSPPDEDDQFDEDLFVGHRRDSPKNLFSSATDAVLSIVKKATAPFMKTDSNDTKSENLEKSTDLKSVSCMSPRYIIVCNNCSQSFYDEVFEILSCRSLGLDEVISNPFVKQTLINSETCTRFGLDFNSLRKGAPFPSNYVENPRQKVNYLTVMLKSSVVAGLCNILAVLENKVVVNATVEGGQPLRNVTESCEVNPSNSEISVTKPSSSCEIDCATQSSSFLTKTSLFTDFFKSSEHFSKKIEPTKTLTEDEVKMLPPSDFYSESSSKTIEEKSTDSTSGHPMPTATPTLGKEKTDAESSTATEQKLSFVDTKSEIVKEVEEKNRSTNGTNNDSTFESILDDINAIEKVSESPSSSVVPSASNLPAESIFLRLANRIKTLEINMSLSSTYLEELSKRYRVQLEFLSKTLNLTIQKMEEQSKANEEKEKKREKEMILLQMQLANLTRDVSALLGEKNSWRPKAFSISQHMFFISVEVLLVWTLYSYCKRFAGEKNASEKFDPPRKIAKKSRRRNSLEGVGGHETPRRKARRPSDEALEIALARNHREDIFKLEKKRKRRRKDTKCSLNVIHVKRKKSEEPSAECPAEVKPSSVSEEIQVPEFIPNNEIELTNRFAAISSPRTPSESNSVVSKPFHSFPSPIFMKTALATRNSRLKSAFDKESSQEQSIDQESKKDRKSSNSLKKYMKKFF